MRQGVLACLQTAQLMVCGISAHAQSLPSDASGVPRAAVSEDNVLPDFASLADDSHAAVQIPSGGLMLSLPTDIDVIEAQYDEPYVLAGVLGGGNSMHSGLIKIRAFSWYPQLEGDMSLDNIFDFGTNVDFHTDLSISDAEAIPLGQVDFRLGRHDLRLSGFTIGMSGAEFASQVITFGNLSIPIGDLVNTDIDLENVHAQYGFSIFTIEDSGFQLGTTLGVDYFHLSASLLVPGTGLQDSIDEHIPIPTVGVHFEFPFENFVVIADVAGLYISVQDIDITFIDASGMVGWRPLHNFGVFAGYRFLGLDATGSDFGFDATFHGPYVGGEIRF